MNVINLAAVRAARKASVCTFEIFGALKDLRRPESTDLVSVGVLGDFETVADMFQKIAEARDASGLDAQGLPAELVQENDGRFWAEGYMHYEQALALRDLCRQRGMMIQAA